MPQTGAGILRYEITIFTFPDASSFTFPFMTTELLEVHCVYHSRGKVSQNLYIDESLIFLDPI